MRRNDIRNIAIIAHVDHGKTTLVDALLRQSGQFRDSQLSGDCILDSNDLERERGITILAKNIALVYKGVKVNIIDTPGHADFGGEVERVLSMADGALILVDAFEGPRPQTRYVVKKALEVRPAADRRHQQGRPPRQPARRSPLRNVRPVRRAGGRRTGPRLPLRLRQRSRRLCLHDPALRSGSIEPLLGSRAAKDSRARRRAECAAADDGHLARMVRVRRPRGDRPHSERNDPPQSEGRADPSTTANTSRAKSTAVELFDKLGRNEVPEADAGDIVALVGLPDPEIGDTVACRERPSALKRISVDEPTLSMVFTINNSPLAGQDGKYVTSRHLRTRLLRELESNVALQVDETGEKDSFTVSGRGILHLSILIETMRREGYELSVGKPQVIRKQIDGHWHEPFEILVVDVPAADVGQVMEQVGVRRGQILEMVTGETGQTHLEFSIPARGLIGLRTKLLNATRGEAIIHHRYESYKPMQGEIPKRPNGVLVSQETGKIVAFALRQTAGAGRNVRRPGRRRLRRNDRRRELA